MMRNSSFVEILILLISFFCLSCDCLVYDDRISALVQVIHSNWRTPLVELSIHEMPKFLKHETVKVKPILPSEEDGRKLIWDIKSDIKMSMTFSESKLILNPFPIYNSKERLYLSKLTLIFEHDGYELINLQSRFSYVPFNSTEPLPYQIEYKWRGTKDEDRPLGVKTLFLISLVLFIGIISVIYTIYERDPIKIKKAPNSGGMYTGGAGIHVRRRPSDGYDKRVKY